MKFNQLLLIFILLSFANSVSAIRCNSRLVITGDSLYKFYKLCGEPDFIEKRVVYRTTTVSSKHINQLKYHTHNEQNMVNQSTNKLTNSINLRSPHQHNSVSNNTKNQYGHSEIEIRHENEQKIQIEVWTYDFGPHRLVQKVLFVDGVAVEISSHGYGFSRK